MSRRFIPFDDIQGVVLDYNNQVGVVVGVGMKNMQPVGLVIEPVPELDTTPATDNVNIQQENIQPLRIRLIPTITGQVGVEIENPRFNPLAGKATGIYLKDLCNELAMKQP